MICLNEDALHILHQKHIKRNIDSLLHLVPVTRTFAGFSSTQQPFELTQPHHHKKTRAFDQNKNLRGPSRTHCRARQGMLCPSYFVRTPLDIHRMKV